jgi:hypothetical protein
LGEIPKKEFQCAKKIVPFYIQAYHSSIIFNHQQTISLMQSKSGFPLRNLCPLFFFSLFGNAFGQANCDCASFSAATRLNFDKAIRTVQFDGALLLINPIKKENSACCQAIAGSMEAILYNAQGKATESFEAAQKAQQFLKGQYHPFASIESTRLMALYYNKKGNTDSAALLYFKSLEMAKKEKQYSVQAKIYANLSLVYMNQKQYGKGLEFTKKSLEAGTAASDTNAMAQSYANLVTAYGDMYEDTGQKAYFDSAQQAAVTALRFAKYVQQPILLMRNYLSLGKFALVKKDFVLAMQYTDSSLLLADGKTNPALLNSVYIDRGAAFLGLKQYAQAIESLQKAEGYCKLLKNPYMDKLVNERLYEAYKANGQTALALQALEKYKGLSDSLVTRQNTEAINEMEQKYNKAENEKKIGELAHQKRVYLLLALTGLLALIGLVFFIRQQSLKSKQKILETEQRLNRARMNPHFFFNTLASLQSFALQGNDGKAMASSLSKFSHIMRETLESTYKEYVTLEQEKEFLEEYLSLQATRFPQQFSFKVDMGTSIEPDETLIPSMILQPFVENSIEHGFAGIDYIGAVTIAFAKEGRDLLVRITDNGKGLTAAPSTNGEHISRASQIIKDRIYLLNVKLKSRASFSIDNNTGGKGVTVFIKLPLLFKQDIKAG